jgi:glycosyltransferase involved in cell wall biosynthesis
MSDASAQQRTTSFSVIMPTYNSAATVEAAIRSALEQTRSDFELIVVDDGSSDDTVARVEEFVRSDERISLVTQSHRGASAARNAALARATGEYVSFLDSDDLWLPRYLEAMAKTLEDNPQAGVAHTDAWVFHQDVGLIARGSLMNRWTPRVVPSEPLDFLRAMLETANFLYYSVTVRRPVLLDVGGFDERLQASVDYELWLRIAAHGHVFVRHAENLAVYRRRSSGQITSNPAAFDRSMPEVYRIVAEEYDVPEDIRKLAQRLREERLVRSSQPTAGKRTLPRALRPLHRVLWRLRWFRFRPPAPVREAFPDLRGT